MSMSHGMDVEQVRAMGNLLKRKSADIQAMISEIEASVSSAPWAGPDAEQFRGSQWPEHRSHLTNIASQLDGFGQSALNNASEQESTSSH